MKKRQLARLESVTKRRSTATCSAQEKDVEGVALESFLHNFLTNHASRKKAGMHLPTSNSLTEIMKASSSGDRKLESQDKKHATQFLSKVKDLDKNVRNSVTELTPSPAEVIPLDTVEAKESGSQRILLVDLPVPDKLDKISHAQLSIGNRPFPKRSTSILAEVEDEEVDDKEAENLRDVSRRILRYQSQGSQSSGDYGLDNSRSPSAKSVSPRRREFQEDRAQVLVDLSSNGTPRNILSPRLTSKDMPSISRRHSFSFRNTCSSSEDDVSVIPSIAKRAQPSLGVIGKVKSVDGSQLLRVEKPTSQISEVSLPESEQNVFQRPSDSANRPSPSRSPSTCDANCLSSGPERRTSCQPKANSECDSGVASTQTAHTPSSKPSKSQEKPWTEGQESSIFSSFTVFFKRFSERRKAKNDSVGNIS